ncbi:MAG: MBL fold metallo-hydrolase [Clostridia bacterium]|nr:MBL fold metallo-hydrolase [Clostridia bacterium]
MEVKVLSSSRYVLTANCYGILSEKAAVVVDCGKYNENVAAFLRGNADKSRIILLTHAHFDHIGGAEELREKTGVPIAIGKTEAQGLADPKYNLSGKFGKPIHPFKADYEILDEQTVTVGDLKIKAYEMPGHTKGSMVYLAGNNLFSGDTLFAGSIGRTDFFSGNPDEMMASLERMLWLFDDSVNVYPGHDQPTTMRDEKINNPYLR